MHMEKYQAHAIAGVSKHNERLWESKGYERENIDNALIRENYNLAPERGDALDFVNSRIASLDLKRAPRKDAVRMVEWVVTLPEGETDAEAFFESTARHMTEVYGEDNVVAAWVHMDEPNARPHMHFDFVPVTEDGRLSAKDIMSRTHLRQMHPRMQELVSADLGHEVPFLLPDEERGRRELSRLDAKDWRAARDELSRAEEQAQAAQERLECLRRDVRECESFEAASVVEMARTAAAPSAGSRIAELEREVRAARSRAEQLECEVFTVRERCRQLENAVVRLMECIQWVPDALSRFAIAIADRLGLPVLNETEVMLSGHGVASDAIYRRRVERGEVPRSIGQKKSI